MFETYVGRRVLVPCRVFWKRETRCECVWKYRWHSVLAPAALREVRAAPVTSIRWRPKERLSVPLLRHELRDRSARFAMPPAVLESFSPHCDAGRIDLNIQRHQESCIHPESHQSLGAAKNSVECGRERLQAQKPKPAFLNPAPQYLRAVRRRGALHHDRDGGNDQDSANPAQSSGVLGRQKNLVAHHFESESKL